MQKEQIPLLDHVALRNWITTLPGYIGVLTEAEHNKLLVTLFNIPGEFYIFEHATSDPRKFLFIEVVRTKALVKSDKDNALLSERICLTPAIRLYYRRFSELEPPNAAASVVSKVLEIGDLKKQGGINRFEILSFLNSLSRDPDITAIHQPRSLLTFAKLAVSDLCRRKFYLLESIVPSFLIEDLEKAGSIISILGLSDALDRVNRKRPKTWVSGIFLYNENRHWEIRTNLSPHES
jgi:hypothetical protein